MEKIIEIWELSVQHGRFAVQHRALNVLGGLTDVLVEVKSCAELSGGGSVTCKSSPCFKYITA